VKRLVIVVGLLVALGVGAITAGQLGLGPVVITREGTQKIIFFLGDVRKVTVPGVSFRLPLVETVETYDSRWLYLNTEALPIQTRDGEQLQVDNYVVWRIGDVVKFKESFPTAAGGDLTLASDRIDRIVRDDVREVIGRHTLSEVLNDQREAIMADIAASTRESLAQYGIVVADVRINRTELPAGTEGSVYARMQTERERLAKKTRAEGDERARRIRAEAAREARVIVANARRDAEITRGEGDAEAARVYAEAYSAAPDFYDFQRSLEAYRKTIGEGTTLVVSPDSGFFRFLERSEPAAGARGSGPALE
jgi:modulator of FtsH protease HflC